MQALEGQVPAAAQAGIKDTLKAQGYFLACQCRPDGTLAIAEDTAGRAGGRVAELDRLSATVLRIRLRVEGDFHYFPGQFVTLVRPDGLARSFSIASLNREDCLEFHVRKIPGGRMSTWMHEELEVGDPLEVRGPHGSCFYVAGRPDQPLLLAGTGTGLAPLYGIARDALEQGHEGGIDLFHGAVNAAGLYLENALRELAERFRNFRYHPCVLHGDSHNSQNVLGAIDEVVLQHCPDMKDYRGYLCGDPDIVNRMKKRFFLAGMNSRDIHSDPFVSAAV